jgi:hypothetical protein
MRIAMSRSVRGDPSPMTVSVSLRTIVHRG